MKKTLKLSPTRVKAVSPLKRAYIALYHCQIMHILTVRGLTFNVLLGESTYVTVLCKRVR